MIKIAEYAGLCSGVCYSLSQLEKAIYDNPDRTIAMYGPIVHNESVLRNYSHKGVKLIHSHYDKNIDMIDIVVTRAHGILKQDYQSLLEKKFMVIDGSCPKINKIKRVVIHDSNAGMTIIYYGKKDHPETQHILSNIPKKYHFISGIEDIEDIRFTDDLYSLYCQTTMNKEKFDDISDRVSRKHPNMEINNCICKATRERQEAAEKLAKEVEFMIVIGGRQSSNTKELYNICRNHTFTILVHDSLEVQDLGILKTYAKQFHDKRIGITAGASTPDYEIDYILNEIKNHMKLL